MALLNQSMQTKLKLNVRGWCFMLKAIGMIEFTSIAKGIETSDLMIKAASVEVIKASTVCPGKYIIIISGDTGNVKAAMEIGKTNAEECIIDSLIIPNVHSQLIPAISMTNQNNETNAVGVLEFYSIVSAVMAADIAVKAANVTLIEVKIGYAIGGKGVVILTGDVGAVRASIEAAKIKSELLCGFTVIPRPSKQLIESLL